MKGDEKDDRKNKNRKKNNKQETKNVFIYKNLNNMIIYKWNIFVQNNKKFNKIQNSRRKNVFR